MWLVYLLTFVKRLAQLGSHTPVYRGIGLQRHGYKEGGVRGFWRRTVWWNISAPAQRSSIVLVVYGDRSRRHMTTAFACSCYSNANMALKPRKQMNTPIYWHDCLLLYCWQNSSYGCFCSMALFDCWVIKKNTEDGQLLFLIHNVG